MEVYDHETVGRNRYAQNQEVHCSASSLFEAVLGRSICLFLVFSSRLLGVLDLNLREVVSKGKQSVSSALKSKKGELMQVGTVSCTFSYLLSRYTCTVSLLYCHVCCQDTLVLYLSCTVMSVVKIHLYCISPVLSCLLPRYTCTVSLLYCQVCYQDMLQLHALYSVPYHLHSCVLHLVILTNCDPNKGEIGIL